MDFPRLICNSLWIFSYFSRTFEDSLETFETMNNRVWGFSFLFFLFFLTNGQRFLSILRDSLWIFRKYEEMPHDSSATVTFLKISVFCLLWFEGWRKENVDWTHSIRFRDSFEILPKLSDRLRSELLTVVGNSCKLFSTWLGNGEESWDYSAAMMRALFPEGGGARRRHRVTWRPPANYDDFKSRDVEKHVSPPPPLFVCLVMYNFKAKKVRAIIVGLMDRFGYQCNDSCMISAWFMQLSSMILGSKRHFRILSLVINRLHYVVNDLSVKRIDSGNFSVR